MVIFRDDPLRPSRLIWIRHAKRETMTVARRKRYRHWPRREIFAAESLALLHIALEG